LDKKVLGIVGYDYIEGTRCPDSWPDELPDDVEQLARGDKSILNVVPTSLTLRPNNDLDINEYIQDEGTYTTKIIEDNILEITHQILPPIISESMPTILVTTPLTQSSHLFTPEPSLNQPSTKRLSNVSATNVKKKKVAVLAM